MAGFYDDNNGSIDLIQTADYSKILDVNKLCEDDSWNSDQE
jgi:hypothetical protein